MNLSNFTAKIGHAAGTFAHAFRASSRTGVGWEGYEQSRERNRPPRGTQSPSFLLDYGVREGLVSEFRDLKRKFSIVGNITRKFGRYCVGNCEVTWNTDDKAFNEAAAADWRSAMNIIDASGEDHFIDITSQVASELVGPGDIFAQQLDAKGYGQLRMIEADRVGNYRGGSVNIDEKNIIGGIILNPNGNGRRVAARVWQRGQHGFYYENPQDIPWQELIHVMRRERPDVIRPETPFSPVLDTLRDLKETKDDEKLAQKIFSRLVLFSKTQTGGFGTGTGITLQAGDGSTPGSSGNTASKADMLELGRGAIWAGKQGDELDALIANRPTEGWRWFIEFLIAEISMALDLPFSVVWKMAGLPGPAVRFELTTANRTFQEVIGTLDRRWYRRVVGWSTAKAMNAGRIPRHPKWYEFTVNRPSSITIDLGRESKIGLDEIDAAAGTLTDYLGEDGKRARDVIFTRAQEERWTLEAAAQFSDAKFIVDPDRVRRPAQTSAQLIGQQMAKENQQQQKADE